MKHQNKFLVSEGFTYNKIKYDMLSKKVSLPLVMEARKTPFTQPP